MPFKTGTLADPPSLASGPNIGGSIPATPEAASVNIADKACQAHEAVAGQQPYNILY